MDDLLAELETEGVASFIASWENLLDTVEASLAAAGPTPEESTTA